MWLANVLFKTMFYQLTNKSFSKEKVKNYKELWEKVQGDHKGLSVCVQTEFKQVKNEEGEVEDNKFSVVMSTATEDRHGEIVNQDWDLKNFKKNPVFLDSHNYNSIEHIIGKVNKIAIKDKNLVGEIEFMLDNPKGMLAYKMAKGGFLNASSVGFIPKQFDEKGNILKSELLEDSAVSVPANPEALFEKEIKTELEVIETIEPEKKSKLESIRDYFRKQEQKRQNILKETLAVMQRLQKDQVESTKRKQMVNRIIKQLIKIK